MVLKTITSERMEGELEPMKKSVFDMFWNEFFGSKCFHSGIDGALFTLVMDKVELVVFILSLPMLAVLTHYDILSEYRYLDTLTRVVALSLNSVMTISLQKQLNLRKGI